MTVYSWGRGEDGQLGVGDTNDQYAPLLVEAFEDKNVKQIACGSGHTVVLTQEGEVWTFGRGDDGRLGHGDNGWKYVPRAVEALKTHVIKLVTCGSYHTAAVTQNGELFTWGGGMYGKLGHGNEIGNAIPRLVEELKYFAVDQVACGSRHTVALLQSHDVYSWGDKENGVSGHGDTAGYQYVPKRIEELSNTNAIQISACGFHTAVLSDAGEIFTFGEGKFGRLGNESERNQSIGQIVESMKGIHIKQVACGGFHTAAISDTGALFTWGGGEHGQLGHGDKVNKMIPCMVECLKDKIIVQVTCGWSHTVGLTDNGEVYTFGNGDHGKLGHNDSHKVTIPKVVESLRWKRVVSVASYNEHTVVLTDPSASFQSSSLSSTHDQDFRRLIDNPDFSDVKFIVEGRPIHAHKSILAVRCEHFQAMFSSGMRESREDTIVIPNIRLPIFMALLEYLYVDSVDVDPPTAIELYVAADLYMLNRLKSLCEIIILKGIKVENAALMLCSSDEANCSRLRELCMRYIIRYFDTVTKTEGFQLLSRELILECLQKR